MPEVIKDKERVRKILEDLREMPGPYFNDLAAYLSGETDRLPATTKDFLAPTGLLDFHWRFPEETEETARKILFRKPENP